MDSENAPFSGQRARIANPAKHFFSKTLLLPGAGIAQLMPSPVTSGGRGFIAFEWPLIYVFVMILMIMLLQVSQEFEVWT